MEAVKVAELDPAEALMVAGTDKAVELELSAIVSPALGTASVMVHVAEAPVPSVVGLHTTAETVSGGTTGVTVPPPPDTAIAAPPGLVPTPPVRLIGTGAVTGPRASETVAIGPSGITAAFMPAAIHMYPPLTALHVMYLPAAVTAALGLTAIVLTLPEG